MRRHRSSNAANLPTALTTARPRLLWSQDSAGSLTKHHRSSEEEPGEPGGLRVDFFIPLVVLQQLL